MQAVSPPKELISNNNNSGWWYHLNVVTWLLSDQSLVTKPTNLTQRVASLFAYLGIWVQLENFPESVYMVMIDDSTQEVSWEKDIILGTKNWNQLANANRPFPSWLVIECWQLFTCGPSQASCRCTRSRKLGTSLTAAAAHRWKIDLGRRILPFLSLDLCPYSAMAHIQHFSPLENFQNILYSQNSFFCV